MALFTGLGRAGGQDLRVVEKLAPQVGRWDADDPRHHSRHMRSIGETAVDGSSTGREMCHLSLRLACTGDKSDAKLLAKTSRQAARHADDQSVGIIEIDLRAHAMGEVPAGTPICDF